MHVDCRLYIVEQGKQLASNESKKWNRTNEYVPINGMRMRMRYENENIGRAKGEFSESDTRLHHPRGDSSEWCVVCRAIRRTRVVGAPSPRSACIGSWGRRRPTVRVVDARYCACQTWLFECAGALCNAPLLAPALLHKKLWRDDEMHKVEKEIEMHKHKHKHKQKQRNLVDTWK